MTQLCEITTCRIRGQHRPDCDGEHCTGCLPRVTHEGHACDSCIGHALVLLGILIDLTPDARAVAAGLVRRGGGGASGKPGSRPPLNPGATDALDELHDRLARLCIDIATQRGVRFHVPCLNSCIKPTPSQAHCGVCHTTFGGITGFDRHRRNGQCIPPETFGYTQDDRGVYRAPVSETEKARLAELREAQANENAPGVPVATPGQTEAVEATTGSQP